MPRVLIEIIVRELCIWNADPICLGVVVDLLPNFGLLLAERLACLLDRSVLADISYLGILPTPLVELEEPSPTIADCLDDSPGNLNLVRRARRVEDLGR